MNTVSIIIATFNRSKLLSQSIESLLAQTYRDLEIIIVDDGSTDDTQAAVSEIALKDGRVKYYSRPHLGICATKNYGLDKAGGEFIGFFDSDDLWPADYIETMVKTLRSKPGYGAVYSKIFQLVDNVIQGEYVTMANPPSGNITADLFASKTFLLPSSTIFRRAAWNGLKWDETVTKTAEDLDIFLRISTRTKFIYMPDTYAIYRKHNNNISSVAGTNLFNDCMRVLERFYFQLNGNMYVPKGFAFRNISHRYRRFAIRNYKVGNRRAAIILLKKAMHYYPFDLRLYLNLIRIFLLNPQKDNLPDWKLPNPLSQPVAGS